MKETNKSKISEQIHPTALKTQALLIIGMLEIGSLLSCGASKNINSEQKPSDLHILYMGLIKDHQDKNSKNKQGKAALFTKEVKEGNDVTKVKGLTLLFDDRVEHYEDFDGSNIIGDHEKDSFSVKFIGKTTVLTDAPRSTLYFYSKEAVVLEERYGVNISRIVYMTNATQMMIAERIKKLDEATQRFKKYKQEIESRMKAGLK